MDEQHQAEPTVLVVFGATGDLMSRKIVPALAYLYQRGRLPERFRVVGFSRRDWDDVRFREHVAGILDGHEGPKPEGTHRTAFLRAFSYQRGTFEDDTAYRSLAEYLDRGDDEWEYCANKLFYLAVPPESYRAIFERIAASGLGEACSGPEGWTRVLVEKPFGKDADTAQQLDELLGTLFREEQIYRIDHYLAKEMLQGILTFRFANNLFEASWDRESIERIDIHLLESLGVETRGEFYDMVGALRDVGQNHLLQMLSLVTMDRPSGLEAAAVRAKRAEMLQSLHRLSPQEVRSQTFRAQYLGYRDAPGVRPDSSTETYFKLRMRLGGSRWAGVPVTLESGKRMGEARKEIVVTFKHPHPCLCGPGGHHQNQVVFTLEPDESITITFWAKKPGLEDRLEERRFDFFLYEREARWQYVEEYAKLLLDAVMGDQTLFVSTAEVRAMWEFIDPIVREWSTGAAPVETYVPDSWEVCERADQALEVAATAGGMRREIGIVGLGKMGAGLARNLMESGWRVVGLNRTPSVTDVLASEGLDPAYSLRELVQTLQPPRTVWVMVPAGDPTEQILFGEEGLLTLLSEGDTVIDGGNSYFQDAVRRAPRFEEAGIDYLDVGTSGGPAGARSGACLMVGGRREPFSRLDALWSDVSVDDGYQFFAGHGAGHFVKMVHNGIEYGMMQAIAEGFNLLHSSEYRLDLARVADVYDHGSVIESRLVAWLESALELHGADLQRVSGVVGSTGEGEWTVRTAEEEGAEIRVIRAALEFRRESERNPNYVGKVLTALRDQFGGHGLGEAQQEAERPART